MKVKITIRSSDPNIASEIAHAKIEGVTIKQQLTIREIVNPPIDFIFDAVKTLALSITAQLIARMIYDKLKGDKNSKLTVNDKSVEINAQKIEQIIINALNEEESS